METQHAGGASRALGREDVLAVLELERLDDDALHRQRRAQVQVRAAVGQQPHKVAAAAALLGARRNERGIGDVVALQPARRRRQAVWVDLQQERRLPLEAYRYKAPSPRPLYKQQGTSLNCAQF